MPNGNGDTTSNRLLWWALVGFAGVSGAMGTILYAQLEGRVGRNESQIERCESTALVHAQATGHASTLAQLDGMRGLIAANVATHREIHLGIERRLARLEDLHDGKPHRSDHPAGHTDEAATLADRDRRKEVGK